MTEGSEDQRTLYYETFLYPENAQISSFFFSLLCNGVWTSIHGAALNDVFTEKLWSITILSLMQDVPVLGMHVSVWMSMFQIM